MKKRGELRREARRINGGERIRQEAMLANAASALRGLPSEVASDLLETFMKDLERAKAYWNNGSGQAAR